MGRGKGLITDSVELSLVSEEDDTNCQRTDVSDMPNNVVQSMKVASKQTFHQS